MTMHPTPPKWTHYRDQRKGKRNDATRTRSERVVKQPINNFFCTGHDKNRNRIPNNKRIPNIDGNGKDSLVYAV